MEDEFFLSSDGSFAAVYDGHGGANVSKYLRQNLYRHVRARRLVLSSFVLLSLLLKSPVPSPPHILREETLYNV